MDKKEIVFVAMSGGVDSSVAALLLKNAGYDVVGIYIKGWSLTGCAEQDASDARRVSGVLGIPFYIFNFENEYKKSVVDYMVSEYAAGRTPNPDVMCNREIKFGLFLKKALMLGADFIATGHYVRLRRPEDKLSSGSLVSKPRLNLKLQIAKDKNKDQSYFLWTLAQNQLKYCLFPLGNYTKPQVRRIAKKYHLPTAEKPDSQGICFIGEINVSKFLKEKLKINPGPIKTANNKTIGIHDGVIFYTIGQRRGIGINGSLPGERGKIYYVSAKDINTNTLWVSEGNEKNLFADELSIKNLNWISGVKPKLPLNCLARIRYRQPLQQTKLNKSSIKIENSKLKNLKVIFNKPQRAVTSGQSAVFYTESGIMLGGGIIV